MGKVHYNIIVTGKVQGVWFRKYTKEKADNLGIFGFVQNEFKGSVYIEAEGSKKDLDQFLDCLHKGSLLSKVSEVVFDIREIQQYTAFEIRY